MLPILFEGVSEAVSEIISEVATSSGETSSITSEIISSATSEGASLPAEIQPVADWIMKAWEWCNQPLPIVGISLVAIIIFLWRVFVSTGYGKKTIKKLTDLSEQTKANSEQALKDAKKENEELKAEIAEMQEQLALTSQVLSKVCESSRNKAVKQAGESLSAKEETAVAVEQSEEVSEDGEAKEA